MTIQHKLSNTVQHCPSCPKRLEMVFGFRDSSLFFNLCIGSQLHQGAVTKYCRDL